MRRAAVVLAFAAATVTGRAAAEAGGVLPILSCEMTGAESVQLKVLIANAGAAFEEDGEVHLTLWSADGEYKVLKALVRCSAWARDHIELVRFGPVEMGDDAPEELEVRGGLQGAPAVKLGTLARGQDGEVRFRRACPEPAEGERRVIVVAAAEVIGANRFTVRLGFFNCGERFDRDYWGFIHFEPEPTGENLSVTTEMGLFPSGQLTDASSWREDEVTVLTFGPFDIPADLDQPIYLRSGMYDHDGDGDRVPLLGSGERQRVVVGRFVSREGRVIFERIPPGGEGTGP